MNLEGFILNHSRVEWVEESVFRRIKESSFLNAYMPPSLVWMEESVKGRRYFSHWAQRVTLNEALLPSAWELVGKLLAEVDQVYFVDFYGFYVEKSVLCLSPTSFTLGTRKDYRVFNQIVTPMPVLLTPQVLEEVRALVEKDMHYMFSSSPPKKHFKKDDPMRQFGWVNDDNEVDFDRLRPEFDLYCQRFDEVLRDLQDELSSKSGKVVLDRVPEMYYRNQYSLDPEILKQEFGILSSSEEESF